MIYACPSPGPVTTWPATKGNDLSVQTADAQETTAGQPSEGTPEIGLRPLTGRDWLISVVWGIFSGLATAAASIALLPLNALALTALLGAGLGVLGYLDHCTQLIRNKHVLVYGAVAAILLVATQTFTDHQILLPALASAVVTFGFFLVLAMRTGFAGGGDIKLSPVPAALLGAISPLAALLWLLLTFTVCVGGMIWFRIVDPTRRHTAMGPYMAVAATLALIAYGLLAIELGL